MHFTKRLLVSAALLLAAVPAFAQNAANQTQLRLVIVDQTGAGIPAALAAISTWLRKSVSRASWPIQSRWP